MTLFNDMLKRITLKELLSVIIILFVIQYLINTLNIVHIDIVWIYIIIIFYFIFKLKDGLATIGGDARELFNLKLFENILLIVILNIFISYGMLYFSNFILKTTALNLASNSLFTGAVAAVAISPISEELIFRGVFLNRLKLIVPTVFAVLISSLLFASLHSFGSIFSAFVFAVCIAVLYLKTDNILVPMFAHFLNNLFAETIVFLDSNNVLFTNDMVIMVMSSLAIVSFVVIFVCVAGQLKILNNND